MITFIPFNQDNKYEYKSRNFLTIYLQKFTLNKIQFLYVKKKRQAKVADTPYYYSDQQ